MKVIDASVMVDLLYGTERGRDLTPLLDDDLFAPDLLVSEVLNWLRKARRRGVINDAEADALVDELAAADIEYLHVWPRVERLWELRHTITPYDACYVVLAEELQAPLVTTDLRLARAVARIVPVIAV